MTKMCCLPLRPGCGLIIVVDALYGLAVLVVHAILLATMHDRADWVPEGFDWLLQQADLDLGTFHHTQMSGYSEFVLLLLGLFYGVVVTASSLFAFRAVLVPGASFFLQSYLMIGWFQLVVFAISSLGKGSRLCKIRERCFPDLEADCDAMYWLYYQRVWFGVFLALFMLWTLGSYVATLASSSAVYSRLGTVDSAVYSVASPQLQMTHTATAPVMRLVPGQSNAFEAGGGLRVASSRPPPSGPQVMASAPPRVAAKGSEFVVASYTPGSGLRPQARR